MNQRLSPRSEALIRDALADERPPVAIERTRIRRGVLAAFAASGTSAAAASGGAVAASKGVASVAGGCSGSLTVAKEIAGAAAGGGGVVATSQGAATTVVGVGTLGLAKGAATGGGIATVWGGAWGAKVTAVVLALGAGTALFQHFPVAESVDGGGEAAAAHQASHTPSGKPSLGGSVVVSPVSPSAVSTGDANPPHATLPSSAAQVSRSGGGGPGSAGTPTRSGRAARVRAEAGAAPARGTRTAGVRPRQAGEAKPPAAPALEQELAVLERVQAELRSGRGDAALALLDKTGSRGAVLAEERLAAEVIAACQAGQVERARRAALSFLARNTGSFLTERVRRSCAFEASQAPRAVTSRH